MAHQSAVGSRKRFSHILYAVEKGLFDGSRGIGADSKIIHKYNLIASNCFSGICPYFEGSLWRSAAKSRLL